jgi:hypothetical protein
MFAKEVKRRELREFEPQGISNMVWGFATLGFKDVEFVEQIALEMKVGFILIDGFNLSRRNCCFVWECILLFLF